MVTKVYFIRHAGPDFDHYNDYERGLSDKGKQNRYLVSSFLKDKKIHAVFSSPYLRAVETVRPFAESQNLSIKSVAWLTWHRERELDFQIVDLAKTEPVWFSKGWKKKFALDLPDDTEDWHHAPQEAHKVVVTDIEFLKGYLSDALVATITYLSNVNETSLDDVVDENWTPAVKRGNRLVSIFDDAAMHSGQAIYSRRLLGREE